MDIQNDPFKVKLLCSQLKERVNKRHTKTIRFTSIHADGFGTFSINFDRPNKKISLNVEIGKSVN